MVFNSYAFLFVYLPIVWGLFRLLLKNNTSLISTYLLIASFVFYGFWDINNFYVLIPSVALNYIAANYIGKNYNKCLFILAIVANVLLLIYYKYLYFLFSILGIKLSNQIDLPLGISFFTFTQITYIVDIYQKKTKPSGFTDYSLFVNYFPHLISGPLIHHKDMIKQFTWKNDEATNYKYYAIGMGFLIVGLFKKVVLADKLAMLYDPTFFTAASNTDAINAWKSVLAYTFQLYFDFSGYSDMAIGISKLFHINMPINFNSPYKATSVIDFWRRWHMTLSSFLKDYIYIPLGGSRSGDRRKLINIFIVMLVCGAWHGAGYTFIIWGIWHGLFLMLNHAWVMWVKSRLQINHKILNFVGWLLTFLVVTIGWVFFKADSLKSATQILRNMFFGNFSAFSVDSGWLIITMAFCLSVFGYNTQEIFSDNSQNTTSIWSTWRPNLVWILILACMLAYALTRIQPMSPFLYWQF